jgi:hypothetical protein
MVMSTEGLESENDCAGKAQQQLQTTDPSSGQRGASHQQTLNCLLVIKILSWDPDGCLTPRQDY